MDTSPEYVKMCEKAPEIQEAFQQGESNVYWDGSLICYNLPNRPWAYVKSSGSGVRFTTYDGTRLNVIWLPRQDQLQEILGGTLREQLDTFYGWLDDITFYPDIDGRLLEEALPSWERVWLAFVMRQNHGKVWDGTQWVLTTGVESI